MKISSLQLGLYQTNCYILSAESSGPAVITDPGYEPERVLQYLQENGLSLCAILLTHGHFDHVGGVREIARRTGCRVYVHKAETTMPHYLTAGELYYTNTYDEGDEFEEAGLHFRCLHTPGHSPGSVCLIHDDAIFCGDTLFRGSCGRTDCPGGSWAEIEQSLRRLYALEGDYHVYPGHGAATTLQRERQVNPFMQGAVQK